METFKVHVQLSWGIEKDYLVANDVEPGLQHRLETREHWQAVMENALINVPVGPYLPSNSVTPPIATAKVLSVAVAKPRELELPRTRSQFIMAEIWQQHDSATNFNFLHHDYSRWSRLQIKADVNYWCTQRRHPLITYLTKLRIVKQRQRLRSEIGY